MSDFDRRVAQLLDDVVPEPPRTLNPAAIRAGQLTDGRRSRPIRTGLAVAAAVLVVAGIVAAIVATRGPSHAPLAVGPQTSPVPQTSGGATIAGPASLESPREITLHAVEHLLAAAPVLPGAVPSAHAPVAALRVAAFTPGETDLVRRTTWATAPGTVVQALGYFAAHLPAEFTQSMTSHSGGAGGREVYSRTFAAGSGWQRPAVYTGLEITISAVRTSTGVAIRLDADAAWLTPRSPASYVRHPTGARVVIRRDGFAPTVRRTLTARGAARLAHLINDLHVPTSGVFNCPETFLGHQDDLISFETPRGVIRVDVGADGCRFVTVHGSHVKQVLSGYIGRTDANAVVLRLLGLPPGYGTH